jgi:general secretion pathway protein I
MTQKPSIRVLVPTRRSGESGFALLEILVAFVVLALGLGAISTGVAGAMRADGRTHTNRTALRLAQSRLEAVGIAEQLVPGRREGRIANHYKWQQTIAAIQVGGDPHVLQGVKPVQTVVNAFWVEVKIQATDGTIARLAALKLAPPATP